MKEFFDAFDATSGDVVYVVIGFLLLGVIGSERYLIWREQKRWDEEARCAARRMAQERLERSKAPSHPPRRSNLS
jgi:hypothetical protein